MANEQQASSSDSSDSMYSLAENVRRVAGTEEKKDKNTTPVTKQAARSKAKARTMPRTTQATARATARAQPKAPATTARTMAKTTIAKTIVVSKEKHEEQEKTAPSDDEYIDIKPGWFWKISTAVLAILVLWAYFFR